MADVSSEVYDLAHSNPTTLQQLSAIAVAKEICRVYLAQCRSESPTAVYRLINHGAPKIISQDLLPNLPRKIIRILDKHTSRLQSSMHDWHEYHDREIFESRTSQNGVLNVFDDIVCDYWGGIHYVRTARRMLLCDKISIKGKFEIACHYSFEDSIREVWPSVNARIGEMWPLVEDEVNQNRNYSHRPFLSYWIYYMKGALHLYPWPDERYQSIYDAMLRKCSCKNQSSLEYFWNRATSDDQYQKALSDPTCASFVLPRLNKQHLKELVTGNGKDLVYENWYSKKDKESALSIWQYVKDLMNEECFTNLIADMLLFETDYYDVTSIGDFDNQEEPYDMEICCEIWHDAAANLKEAATKKILSTKDQFEREDLETEPRETVFLQVVLQDAPIEEKQLFWRQNWKSFLPSTSLNHFDQLLKLCLADENQIEQFKMNTLCWYENLKEILWVYLWENRIEELITLLNFCSFDAKGNELLKRRLLQDIILDLNPNEDDFLHLAQESILKLINDTYAGKLWLLNDFSNQFFSSPFIKEIMLRCVSGEQFAGVKQLVKWFASQGQNVDHIKRKLVNILKDCLVDRSMRFLHPSYSGKMSALLLDDFVYWCFGFDYDQVIEFKRSISISPDQLVHNMLQNNLIWYHDAPANARLVRYPINLDEFLLWYFIAPKIVDEFKKQMTDFFQIYKNR